MKVVIIRGAEVKSTGVSSKRLVSSVVRSVLRVDNPQMAMKSALNSLSVSIPIDPNELRSKFVEYVQALQNYCDDSYFLEDYVR